MTDATLLITGASGALGHLVATALAEDDHSALILGSRSPGKLKAFTDRGIETRHVDFDDQTSLTSSFAQVDTVLIVSTDELARPGHRQRQHRIALHAAIAAGVRRIAYTSMPNPASSPAIPFAPDHMAMEAAIEASGLAHAIFRNGWYQENLLGYLPWIIASGTWFTTAGFGRIPFVSRADTAEATAAVLADARLGSGLIDIAGPEYLMIEDIAALVQDVLGRPLCVEQVSETRLAQELTRQGVPAAMIPLVVATDANQRAGAFEVGEGDLPRLLRRPPTIMAEFLRRHADRLLAPIYA